MPQPPSDWLRNIGLAEFTPSAIGDIGLYAETWVGREVAHTEEFRAFIELGAVEFALAPLYRGTLSSGATRILEGIQQPNPVFPVGVSDRNAADAIYKTNCGPFSEHSRKSREELRPWDVFAFAGDMSKFELLRRSGDVEVSDDVNALSDPRIMQTALDALARRYTDAGLGSRVVESGLLAAQGLIWFAKLALLRGEDYTEAQDLPSARARFFRGPATIW